MKKHSKYENLDSLDIKRKIMLYIANWRYFLLASIIFVSLAFAYLKAASKIYETTAKIKILDNSKELNISIDALSMLSKSNINLENEIEVLKSYKLLNSVVDELNLETQYFIRENNTIQETITNPLIIKANTKIENIAYPLHYVIKIDDNGYKIIDKKSDSKTLSNSFYFNSSLSNFPILIYPTNKEKIKQFLGKEYEVIIDSKINTVHKITDNLQIKNIGKESEVLSISLTGKNRAKSERIINAIIKQFNYDGVKDRQLVSQRTIDFVNDRFQFLSKELDSIEESKKNYKEGNNLSYMEFDVENSLKNKSISETELFRVETQIELAKFLKDVLANSDSHLIPVDIGLENAEINQSINELNKLVLENQRLSSSGGKNNPTIQTLKNDIDETKRNIILSIENYNKKLKIELSKLKKVNNEFRTQFSKLPEKEKKLRAIERQQGIKESLYLLLLQKREEAAINLAITNPSVKIVDYAISDNNPVFPKPPIIYSVALLLSLFVPFSVINLKKIINSKIENKHDVESVLPKIPIIGEIPFLKQLQSGKSSVLTDMFNLVCANISFMLPENNNQGKTIFITSSIKNEGKTFCSINIAKSYASLGKRVLLIGADLRNPQIENHLMIDKNSKGLSNYLYSDNLGIKSIINNYDVHETSLDIIFSGTIPPNPANLLINGKFKELIDRAKLEYDYIIVDTAPTLLVSDTKLIAKHADVIVVIVRTNHSEKGLLNHIKENINQFKIKKVGVLVNSSKIEANKKYNYGYKYGYY